MGTGTLLDGEGHERVSSMLSRSIGMTVYETEENRHLDIALLLEHYNAKKVDGLLTFTTNKIRHVHQRVNGLLLSTPNLLDNLVEYTKCSNMYRLVNSNLHCSYQEAITMNREWRKECWASRKARDAAALAEIHYVAAETAVRAIVDIDRLLGSKTGQGMASKLREKQKKRVAEAELHVRNYNGCARIHFQHCNTLKITV